MRAVLKLGGSLLYNNDGKVNLNRIRKYAETIMALAKKGHQLVVIVGGGKPARMFISAARDLGASETHCDWLGIKISRLNAELLCAALGEIAFPKVVESLDEMEKAFCFGKVVLLGGLMPGQSTNAVAALVAELINAKYLLNATNVDGVYDRDPKEQGAKRLNEVSIEDLKRILAKEGTRAGEYELFDPVAIRVVERSKISTVIFDGRNPEALLWIFAGKKIGTTITHEKPGGLKDAENT